MVQISENRDANFITVLRISVLNRLHNRQPRVTSLESGMHLLHCLNVVFHSQLLFFSVIFPEIDSVSDFLRRVFLLGLGPVVLQ